jgi:hypothetical protein
MMAFLKAAFPRALTCILAGSFFLFIGCKQNTPAPTAANPGVDSVAHTNFRGTPRDLSADESAGGHTLSKHVGRTDEELRERLAREDISASSTYTDREAAEFAVGSALQEGQTRVEQWMQRSGSHPNLVLDYHSDQPIGRTLHRGASSAQPCSDAKVVLRWLSSSEYYVLTSYPECR